MERAEPADRAVSQPAVETGAPAGAAEPYARIMGFLLFGGAAAAAALGPLWLDGALTVQAAREAGPLAAALGGGLGALVMTAWPRSALGGAAIGALTAFVGLVFFCGLYLFAEGVIAAFQDRPAGPTIAAAVERLGARLPIGAPAALAAFAAAGVVMRLLGGLGRSVSRQRSARRSRPRGAGAARRRAS